MIRILIVIALLSMLALAGCREEANASMDRGTAASGPKQTVARMLELAEAGDWATYIDDYYGETHKFRDDRDRQKLIDRYETRWGATVVQMLQPVSKVEPQLSDDGNQAIFDMGGGQRFILYRDPDGSWKFHL